MVRPKHTMEISVMFSKHEPFVVESNRSDMIKGLDVSIIANFARKFNLQTKYIRSNESLISAFYLENAFENVSGEHSTE